MTKLARLAALGSAWLFVSIATALAQGGPKPWQKTLNEPATKVMDNIVWFNAYTLVIVTLITVFVLGLLAWCIVKYSQKANPEPSRVTHNSLLEAVWTIVPILILVAIAIPSFKLLYGQYDPSRIYDDFDPKTAKFLTVKATGYQWYWGYEYADGGENAELGVEQEVSFDSIMLADDERGPGDPRLLAVDNQMVVPVSTFVRLQVTAADVIHSFAMPSFGVKVDAVPGRLNETYFKAEREGLFYGQCSELCGKDHAYMPIAVRVVSQDQFKTWVAAAAGDLEDANKTLARLIEAEKNNKVALR
ncbi:MAG: cytochrome c oxidase subunit II [Hyphomicrobiales bacterium]|nr:cytochrome c oxidase subunit II [Hyphomicrobiales bacterium]